MTEKLKPSRYNHFVEIGNGKRLAFNALSCGLGEMDDENYQKYLKLTGGNGCSNCSDCGELLTDLKKGGFLIPEDIDELDGIRAGHYKARFGTNGFGLTLLPTYNCNFGCDYCYENSDLHSMSPKEGSVMSDEVIDNIVKLCEKEIPEKSSFSVTWYGGEPLMGKKVIEKLTKEFIRICEEKESKYNAGMITNGYLLNKETLDFIIKMKVSFIQVTIDGPKEIHDIRRCLKGGGKTYDRIMSNLENIKEDTPISVGIRANIDNRNKKSIISLFEDFKKRGFHQQNNISISFGHVISDTNGCPDISSHCMVTQEFSEFLVSANIQAMELGFKVKDYPNRMLGSCGAVGAGMIVIEPCGRIQNCWETVGHDDKKTGVLSADGIKYTENYVKWQGWTVFEKKNCISCDILPICMGGCPYRTIEKDNATNRENYSCVSWKYNLKPMLTLMKQAKEQDLLAVRGSNKKTDNKEAKEKNVA